MAESSQKGKKTLWEKEKLLVMSNSPFLTVFSKDSSCRHKGLFGKGLRPNCNLGNQLQQDIKHYVITICKTIILQDHINKSDELKLYHTVPTFNISGKESFTKHCGKRRKFSPFPIIVITGPISHIS